MESSRFGANFALSRRISVAQLNQHRHHLEANDQVCSTLSRRSSMSQIVLNASKTFDFSSPHSRHSIDNMTHPDKTTSDKGDSDMATRPQGSPQGSPTKRVLMPPPNHPRNSYGLLDFRASPEKRQSATHTGRTHRRTQSLQIPIMIARQRSEQCEPAQKEEQVSPALARAERELAFLHNNTFIGTTSLSDFLNTLETSTCPPFVTLSSAIIRAFSELAAKEEKYARSQSKTTVELPAWDNMRKVDTETPDFDFVSLARVKLGTVSLAEFLEEIRKGQQVKDWSVGLPWVVAVFEKLAQKDMEREANGKAKALRRWLVGGLVEEY